MPIINSHNNTIPDNFNDIVPILTYTFIGNETAGTYQFGGRLLDVIFGDHLSTSIEPFTFTP